MTVQTTESRISYTGNGTVGPFSFPYYFLDDADLIVIRTLIADGSETTLTITTDYTVSGAGDENGGSVTLVASLSSAYTLTIVRDPEILQETDYLENDTFPAESHERALDRLTMIAQRTRSLITRGLVQPESDLADIGRMPTQAQRAGRFLTFDLNGDPTASDDATGYPASPFMQTVLDDPDAATARATLGAGTGDVEAGPITTSGLTMSTARILGRTTAGTGAIEELDAAAVRAFSNVLTTRGDLIRGGVSGVQERVALGGVGQVLRSDGTDAVWGSPVTLGTPQASTSGTSIDFTGIPSTAKRIAVNFTGVSTNGTSNPMIQLGDSGGIEPTGYLSGSAGISSAGTLNAVANTTGFIIKNTHAGTTIFHGCVTLTLEDPASNEWSATGIIWDSASTALYCSAGTKSLSAVLDRVRITMVNGTDAFDAGAINIAYE